MKMIPVKLHHGLYEGLEKVRSLYGLPDVTSMLNFIVLGFLKSVAGDPQSGIFCDLEDENDG